MRQWTEIVVRNNITVPEQDIQRAYRQNIDQYTQAEQVRASHILLNTEGKDEAAVRARAEELLKHPSMQAITLVDIDPGASWVDALLRDRPAGAVTPTGGASAASPAGGDGGRLDPGPAALGTAAGAPG